ncbi:MAG: trypsin-like serine protease [Deltaproteobacteria bacterium]|nr:trypsin-like serine protease [Deltaproteobacteria bacterium]
MTIEEMRELTRSIEPVPFPDISRAKASDEPVRLIYKYDPRTRPINPAWNEIPWEPVLAEPPATLAGGPSRITATESYPYSSAVLLYMDWGSGYGGCSGMFIHNTHTILTAGHCVYNHDEGGLADEIIVVPAKDGSEEPFGYKFAYNFATNSGWANYEDYTQDWAVISVEPFGAGGTGFLDSIYDGSSSWYYAREFDTAGYPGEYPYPGDQMWWEQDGVLDVSTAMIEMDYNFGSYPYYCIPGQSGSGVYLNQGGGNYAVTAVLTLASCHCVRLNATIDNFLMNFDDCDGCLIGGTCYDDGDVNSSNPCQKCDPDLAYSAWSPRNGVPCNDGLWCNGDDHCNGGSCSQHEGDPCPAGEFCVESADECSEEPVDDDADDDGDDDDDFTDDDDVGPDGIDCSDLLTILYTECGFAIVDSDGPLEGDTAYELCKEGTGPWECVDACRHHEAVDDCDSFQACLDERCGVTVKSTGTDDDGDDDDDAAGDDDDDDDDDDACGASCGL